MNLCRILVDSLADKSLPNAQMANAREIIRRLDPARFHVSVFCLGEPYRISVTSLGGLAGSTVNSSTGTPSLAIGRSFFSA